MMITQTAQTTWWLHRQHDDYTDMMIVWSQHDDRADCTDNMMIALIWWSYDHNMMVTQTTLTTDDYTDMMIVWSQHDGCTNNDCYVALMIVWWQYDNWLMSI